jgi:ribonuclease Z
MRKVLVVITLLLAGTAGWVVMTPSGQDFILPLLLDRAIGPVQPSGNDQLDVLVCGSAAPVRQPGRAQACVAIRAGDRLVLVDAGAGSAMVLAQTGWPLEHLESVFLTHFHSDHIGAIPEINLNSWVAGRPRPLRVLGPEGVERVVDGLNEAYALDRAYRTAHHGQALMPAALGVLQAERIEPGSLDLGDGLTVRAALVNHDPISPAMAYRFDYQGRSVVVSGDTVVSDALIDLAQGADLLLHDALSMRLIGAMAARMGEVGRDRMQWVLLDVTDYHAHVAELTAVAQRAGVNRLALYHLVPAFDNTLFERIFRRGLPNDVIVTRDGTRFEMPPGSAEIRISEP